MSDFQTFRLRLDPLRESAEALRPKVKHNPRLEAALASALFHLEIAETGMTMLVSNDQAAERWVDVVLRRAREILAATEAGRDYFQGKTGVLAKAYLSKLDDSLQPYILQVPDKPVPGGERRALVVVLHGWGAQRSLMNWGDPRNFEPWTEDYLRLQVYGRGWTRYKGVGTDDVFTAMAEVQRDYAIDPDRVYLSGGSMGGAGTWFLATHFPGVFAAAAPIAGYTDYRLDFGSANAKPEWEHRLYRAHDALTSAVNLKASPVYFCHGDRDLPGAFGGGVSVEHSRVMARRLKELDIPFRYDELPGVEHNVGREQQRKSERWLLDHRRNPNPPAVSLQTSSLRFPRAYWVEVEGLREHFRESRIEARCEGARLTVRTEGITDFALTTGGAVPRSGRLACEIDGQAIELPDPRPEKLHFALEAGKWRPAPLAPGGLRKKHGLQGPWVDAFLEPAVYVLPSSNARYADLARFDLETLERAHGGLDCSNIRGRAEIAIPMKKDADITAADIAGRHLLVFGDPECNLVLARVENRLPIRWTRAALLAGERRLEGELVGAKFLYPNPLNPEKYVAVATGTRPEALYALRIFHWQLPDYLVFGPEAARVGEVPYYDAGAEHQRIVEGAYRLAGFFDERWRLREPNI